MATKKDLKALLEQISTKYDISVDDLFKIGGIKKNPYGIFASKAAEKLATEKGLKFEAQDEKITIDQVKIAAGEPKKIENLFASTTAKKLAEDHNLTQDDFSDSEKSGKPRKSGAKTITIDDARKKAGIAKIKKTTKTAKLKQ